MIVEKMTLKGLVTDEWVSVSLMEDGSMVWNQAQIRRVDERHMASNKMIYPAESPVDRGGST